MTCAGEAWRVTLGAGGGAAAAAAPGHAHNAAASTAPRPPATPFLITRTRELYGFSGPREHSRCVASLRIPMGELGAFLKIHRVGFDKRDPQQRMRDYKQYFALQPDEELQRQGARC